MVVGEFTQETDLAVIGAGPAGYSAAFRAAELGIATVLIDPRPQLGGVCLHAGCIPSKTLLHVADLLEHVRSAARFGVLIDEPRLDLDTMRQWMASSIERLAKGLASTAHRLGVETIQGSARFDDSRSLTVTNGSVMRVRFRRALIATGSSTRPHPDLPFEHAVVWSPADALAITEIPKRLTIIGHGYMTAELAMIYAALGSQVTIICEQEQLLPGADDDLMRPVLASLKHRVDGLHIAAKIDTITLRDHNASLAISGQPDDTEADRVIIAHGQEPNLTGLALERTQITRDADGFITIDAQMRTTDPRIFAAGDVTGEPLLADRALHQGRVAAEVIAGWDSEYDVRAVPHAVFTNPQVAWCGMTEREASQAGREVTIAKLRWGASGRAVAMDRADGLTKLICEPDTELLLGVGIVGPHAVEMIGEAALAIEMGATATDLAETMHPHPSMCELLRDAAQTVANQAPPQP